MAKLEKQSFSPPPGQIKHDDHSIGTLDASSYDTKGTLTTANDEYFGDGNKPRTTISRSTTRPTSSSG